MCLLQEWVRCGWMSSAGCHRQRHGRLAAGKPLTPSWPLRLPGLWELVVLPGQSWHRARKKEGCSPLPDADTPSAFPPQVPSEKCRCAVGSILSEGEQSPSPELIQLYQRFGFKLFSFPAPSHVVTATFPYTTALSIWLAARRVHPALDTYIKERKLCAHPRLEIYQQDRIHFMCPLARQGDFYVPEVKETERRSRGPVETSDAPTDGTGADTMSDTSSVSLEVRPSSREASATTLSPGASSHGWDDGDTRSEHSYSESGTSGSSFEELDLEVEGPLGEPRLDPEAKPVGATSRAQYH